MSRKLHKFQTVAEYQAYSASTDYTTPCVAVVEENNVIYYDYGDNKPQADLSDYKLESEETSVGGDKYGNSAITKINYIPSGITSLNYAFSVYSSLEEVTCEIPDSVTDMSSTFQGCTSLATAPVIPSGVTNMSYTFAGCSSLVTAPEIPSGVTNMYLAFDGCTSLKEVTFLHTTPPSMQSALQGCSSLETIYVPDKSVDAYKTATGWSEFADKIKPLSSKPSE